VKPGAAVQVAVFTSEPAKVASNEKPGVAP
jgi:hypothetical protein